MAAMGLHGFLYRLGRRGTSYHCGLRFGALLTIKQMRLVFPGVGFLLDLHVDTKPRSKLQNIPPCQHA